MCCPFCSWPDEQPYTTVSVHQTNAGATMWTRCMCGSLQTRVMQGAQAVVTARGKPTNIDLVNQQAAA